MERSGNDSTYQVPDVAMIDDILMDMDGPNLDFFDPFMGNTYDHFALPTLPDGNEFQFSPDRASEAGSENVSRTSLLNTTLLHHEARENSQRASVPAVSNVRAGELMPRSHDKSATPSTSKSATPYFGEEAHTHTWNDLCSRLNVTTLSTFKLPTPALIRKWLRLYVDAFHVHFPFLHLPTLDLTKIPSPLTLAVCAIGALYRLNRPAAVALHVKAVQCLDALEVNIPSLILEQKLLYGWTKPTCTPGRQTKRPLWYSQARILSLVFTIFSGDPMIVRKSFEDFGILSSDYRVRLWDVKAGSSDRIISSWTAWVERESSKRFLHMCFILSNLSNITYGVPPAFCLSQDGTVEMPDNDVFWQAQTEDQWSQLISTQPTVSLISVRDAAGLITGGAPMDELCGILGAWSVFGTSVVMHAISTQIWQITQGAMFGDLSNSQGMFQENGQSVSIAKRTQTVLNRCRDLLLEAHSKSSDADHDTESPMLFNSFAILRVSFSRAFTSVGLSNRELLLYESKDAMISAIHDYISLRQERGESTTKSVERSFEGLIIPFQSSPLFVRKTAALTWSIEHALAGWDSERLDKKGAPITDHEREVLDKVRSLVEEEDYDGSDILLASNLARLWACFYDDTWVWGVTPRIGWVLRELGNAYETLVET
ncbi:hypothetical protein LTS08_008509 [Lithohypha guttulata]|nr:hypothetical protein LTS08_008509 [Lithohypha guttulata]